MKFLSRRPGAAQEKIIGGFYEKKEDVEEVLNSLKERGLVVEHDKQHYLFSVEPGYYRYRARGRQPDTVSDFSDKQQQEALREIRVLRHLEDYPGVNQEELAAALYETPGRIMAALKALQAAGVVVPKEEGFVPAALEEADSAAMPAGLSDEEAEKARIKGLILKYLSYRPSADEEGIVRGFYEKREDVLEALDELREEGLVREDEDGYRLPVAPKRSRKSVDAVNELEDEDQEEAALEGKLVELVSKRPGLRIPAMMLALDENPERIAERLKHLAGQELVVEREQGFYLPEEARKGGE